MVQRTSSSPQPARRVAKTTATTALPRRAVWAAGTAGRAAIDMTATIREPARARYRTLPLEWPAHVRPHVSRLDGIFRREWCPGAATRGGARETGGSRAGRI